MTAKFSASADGTKVTIGTAAEDALQIDATAKTIKAVAPYSLQPSGPAFSAYLNATTQAVPINTPTKVNLDTEEFDTNNCFSAGRFTPTVAGYYQVSFAVNWAAMVAQVRAAFVLKNGVRHKDGASSGNNGSASGEPSTAAGAALVYLNGTTDYIELGAQNSNTGGSTINGGNIAYTYMTAALIRTT